MEQEGTAISYEASQYQPVARSHSKGRDSGPSRWAALIIMLKTSKYILEKLEECVGVRPFRQSSINIISLHSTWIDNEQWVQDRSVSQANVWSALFCSYKRGLAEQATTRLTGPRAEELPSLRSLLRVSSRNHQMERPPSSFTFSFPCLWDSNYF